LTGKIIKILDLGKLFHQEVDPSGLNAQMAGLRGGLTLAQIRQAIAESPEGRARR
jgi:hypothetical protein